jgi:hypothetical protein
MVVPQPFTLILPALASMIAGWLKDDELPSVANFAIIVVLFALAVAACVLVGGGLSGNPGADISLIIAECAAVFGLLKPVMDQAAKTVPSPIAAAARVHADASAVFAAPIMPVAQRASDPIKEQSPVQPRISLPAKTSPPPESQPAPAPGEGGGSAS